MTDGQAALVDGAAGAGAGSGRPRAALWWWALLVIPLWLVLALCAHREPVLRDGDDFEIREVREPAAKIFGLASVALEPAAR